MVKARPIVNTFFNFSACSIWVHFAKMSFCAGQHRCETSMAIGG